MDTPQNNCQCERCAVLRETIEDPCQFDPVTGQKVTNVNVHAWANFVVAIGDTDWRVCRRCARLPKFAGAEKAEILRERVVT